MPTTDEESDDLDRLCSARVWGRRNAKMIGIDVSKESLTCTYVDPVRRVPLWSHPALLAAFVTVLGAFWVARKAAGLI